MIHTESHPGCDDCLSCPESVFSCLKEKELVALNEVKSTRKYKKGEIVFFENDHVKGLHCIVSGKVKKFKTLDNGDIQILKICKENDLLGYRGLLGDGKYLSSAETIEDSEICFIPKHVILELLKSNSQFSLKILSKFASDVSDAEEKSIRFVNKSSRERLAEALLNLENNFGTNSDGFIQIKLSRHEIAAFTGLATETIIRALSTWKDKEIIQLENKMIKILDKEQLTHISNTPE